MPVIDRCRLTSGFGKRDIDHGPKDHWGLDFGGPVSGKSTYVKAAAAGVVVWIKYIPLRSGPCIGIRHPDGSLTNYVHTRAHKVSVGQKVERGEIIAETWTTGLKGGTATKPAPAGIHLHFEWWADWQNHYSVFDPTKRLADYGWVLKWDAKEGKYRLHDEWEGRPHKTPPKPVVVVKPVPKPKPTVKPKKELINMDEKQLEALIRRVVSEEIDKNEKRRGVRWQDSTTGETKQFTKDQALGYFSEHWNRETVRDAETVARDEAHYQKEA